MRRHNGLLILSIALLLAYFLVQTAAEAFLNFHTPNQNDLTWLKRAVKLRPFASEPMLQLGFAQLEMGRKQENEEIIKESINHFKQAITHNPLVYQAHLNLGKAYLILSSYEPQWVGDGIQAFKRSASIRGANLTVAMDTSRLFFSLWPLLKEEDQRFVQDLLMGVMHRIGKRNFTELVGLWALYNRHIEVMEKLIAIRPEFSHIVAQALVKNRQYNEQRRQLLNTYDQIQYKELSRRVEEELNIMLQPPFVYEKGLQLFKELGEVYHRYDRLNGEETFPEKIRLSLRRRLGERLLLNMIDAEGGWRTDSKRGAIDKVVSELIFDSKSYENVFELEDRLSKIGYYREGDLKAFLAKQQIMFQTARYDQVIDQIETLRRELSFIREDAREEMIRTLFLLCESYRQSRLLTMASRVLDDLEALNAPPEPLLWQRYMIEKVIAVEADANMVENWRAQFAQTRTVWLNAEKHSQTVYFDESLEVQLDLSDEIAQKGMEGRYNLIEVYAPEGIIWDSYLGEANRYTITFPETYRDKAVSVTFVLR